MEQEVLVRHAWHPDPYPAGATAWPTVVGHLLGRGMARRATTARAIAVHLIIRGRGTFKSDAADVALAEGDMLCMWPGVAHDFQEDPSDRLEFYWTRLDGPDTERVARQWGFSPRRPVCRVGMPGSAEQAFRSLFDYWSGRRRDPFEGLALFFRLVSVSAQREEKKTHPSSPAEVVREGKACIESLLETGVNVNELADMLHVSRTTLWRAFKDETGTTVTAWIQAARLARAREILDQTGFALPEVARMCGFRDVKYFMRSFREAMGVTPGRYREGRGNL